jgi:protein arginine kinase
MKPIDENHTSIQELFLGTIPWLDCRGEIGTASRVLLGKDTVYRNVPELPFTVTASDSQHQRILNDCINWLFKMSTEDVGEKVQWQGPLPMENMSLEGYRMFLERMLLLDKEPLHGSVASKKRQLFFSPTGDQSLIVNGVEHMSWSRLYSGHELWEQDQNTRRQTIEKTLALASWASREDWGIQTSDVQYLGAGFGQQALVHLPGILGSRSKEVQTAFFRSIKAMGLHGSWVGEWGEQGHCLWLSSQSHLGKRSEEIQQGFIQTLEKILEEEVKQEERWLEEEHDFLEDKIFRSVSLLLGARSMPLQELLELSSWVQLGTYAGWISPLSLDIVRTLLIRSSLGHIKLGEADSMDQEDGDRLRATMVRLTLQEAGL